MSKKAIILIVLIVVTLIASFRIYAHYTHWSMQKIDDRTEIPLSSEVLTIRDGLPFAEDRAKKWRKEAILTNINVVFDGKDAIIKRRGRIGYEYYVENRETIGLPFALCWVDINISKQVIDRVQAFGGKKLSGTTLDISQWNIDIDDAFNLVEKNVGLNIINKFENPKVVIRTSSKFWEFAIFTSTDNNSSRQEKVIVIDPVKNEIIKR